MLPKLLLIEDSDSDARLAIQSLTEAGEEFDYTHVRRLGDAMWELEATPRKNYQKIYLDLGLSEVKGQATAVIETLAKYVGGRENIIAVSAHPQSGTSETIRARGTEVLGRESLANDQGLLASLFFNQQANHEKSVARHRELTRIEIKLVQLEQEVDLKFENAQEHREQLMTLLRELKNNVGLLEDRMNILEIQVTNTSTLNLKRFEVRWQIVVAVLGGLAAVAAAVLPKLLDRKP